MRRAGFDVIRYRTGGGHAAAGAASPDPLDLADEAIARAVAPFTMTSRERLQAAIDAARYAARYRIPGAIVECGVWRGGSMMAMARALMEEGDTSRDLFLFDTFEGMPPPSDADKDRTGAPAKDLLRLTPPQTGIWCYASLDDVRANLARTGYPAERLHFVPGRVEQTIPHAALAGAIAVLRLDTDWYESTRHELVHLYPQISPAGVLIVDDYGHWQGARRATDEYLADNVRAPLLLQRTDYTGRMAVKPMNGPPVP